MVVLKPPRSLRQGQTALAVAFAILAHLAAFLALGWRIPELKTPEVAETPPDLEISLVRPPRAASAPAASSAGHARSALAPAAGAVAPVSPITVPAAPAPSQGAVATGSADCEPEDLPLLTDEEQARCRNEINADRGRRLARERDGRLAKEVAKLQAVPRIDSIPAEKRAYYDAVAAAYDQQAHGPPMAGRLPGIACGGKPPHSLKIGPMPCYVTPPQGFLTEESGTDPLDPQWLPKK